MGHVSEALIAPSHCTACFSQHTDKRHVDFHAAYDGPVFREGITSATGEITHTVQTQIDDLILCETCVLAAARVLGVEPGGEEELERAKRQLAAAREHISELNTHISSLEQAVSTKPQTRKPRQQVAA